MDSKKASVWLTCRVTHQGCGRGQKIKAAFLEKMTSELCLCRSEPIKEGEKGALSGEGTVAEESALHSGNKLSTRATGGGGDGGEWSWGAVSGWHMKGPLGHVKASEDQGEIFRRKVTRLNVASEGQLWAGKWKMGWKIKVKSRCWKTQSSSFDNNVIDR